ncbi:MAG: ATP synthase subunit I [Idiomarina sp.]|nr:ATP synthase subunit I [Idiomarina sp.]
MTGATKHPILGAGRRFAWRIILVQALLAPVLILIFGLTMSTAGAMSALAGAVIALVPSMLFVVLAFRFGGARYVPNVVQYFFIAEAVKWLTTIALLIVAFNTLSGPWLPLLVTLFVILHVQWVAPVFLNSKTT